EVRVVTTLAQDTIVAAGVEVPAGLNQVGVFANPFVEGLVEQLFINQAGRLMWLRHTVLEGEAPGWALVALTNTAGEAVRADEVPVLLREPQRRADGHAVPAGGAVGRGGGRAALAAAAGPGAGQRGAARAGQPGRVRHGRGRSDAEQPQGVRPPAQRCAERDR